MGDQQASTSESARGITERLRSDSRQQIDSRKRVAADRVEEFAHALSRASEHLEHQPTLANYANQIANSVGNLATRLREGSVEDLLEDTRQLARRNPGMFILGGFAVGVALARFLKASGQSTEYSGEYSGERSELSSEGLQAGASQPEHPSGAYSSSPGSVEQPYTTPGAGG